MTTLRVDDAGLPTDTRQRLLDVAIKLISQYGFAGTSLQMIADELGFTKAAIYYHFRTRDDLLSALMEPILRAESSYPRGGRESAHAARSDGSHGSRLRRDRHEESVACSRHGLRFKRPPHTSDAGRMGRNHRASAGTAHAARVRCCRLHKSYCAFQWFSGSGHCCTTRHRRACTHRGAIYYRSPHHGASSASTPARH